MAANPVVVSHSLEGRVLLGWFERDMVVRYLTQACVFDPPITDAEAEAIWRPYRDRCEALSEREAAAPSLIPLNHDERQHAKQFLATLAKLWAHTIQAFIKINLSRLVVHQFYVVVSRSNHLYLNPERPQRGWLHKPPPLFPPPPPTSKLN